jgi:hypothetical protein
MSEADIVCVISPLRASGKSKRMFKSNGSYSDQEEVEKGETVKNTRWQSSVLIFLSPET